MRSGGVGIEMTFVRVRLSYSRATPLVGNLSLTSRPRLEQRQPFPPGEDVDVGARRLDCYDQGASSYRVETI